MFSLFLIEIQWSKLVSNIEISPYFVVVIVVPVAATAAVVVLS